MTQILKTFVLRAGKVYLRGFAVFFTGSNIVDIYNKKDIREEMEGKFVLSAVWPVTVPIIATFSGVHPIKYDFI